MMYVGLMTGMGVAGRRALQEEGLAWDACGKAGGL